MSVSRRDAKMLSKYGQLAGNQGDENMRKTQITANTNLKDALVHARKHGCVIKEKEHSGQWYITHVRLGGMILRMGQHGIGVGAARRLMKLSQPGYRIGREAHGAAVARPGPATTIPKAARVIRQEAESRMSKGTKPMASPVPGFHWVDVERARRWLGCVSSNRVVSKGTVARYSRTMAAELWDNDNPQPIIFTPDGKLIDGQHRLHAIIASEIKVRLNICIAPEKVFKVIDEGHRTCSNVLQAMGYNYCSNDFAAALKMLYRWRNGSFAQAAGGYKALTNAEFFAFAVDNAPTMERSIDVGGKTKASLGYSSSWIFCHHLFKEKDSDYADLFCDAVNAGTSLRKKDPEYLLRERIVRIRLADAKDRTHTPTVQIVRLIITAWNASRSGRNIVRLPRFEPDVPFPEIV